MGGVGGEPREDHSREDHYPDSLPCYQLSGVARVATSETKISGNGRRECKLEHVQ